MFTRVTISVPGPGPSDAYSDQFPHLEFARGPRSPALGERMWAAVGDPGECSAGPIHSVANALILIIFYQ